MIYQTIKSQVTTEKSVKQQEKDQWTFYVHNDATKIDIKIAFKEIWDVDVVSVRIVKTPPKMKTMTKRGAQVKRLPKKKAIVKLKPNQNFELLKFAGAK